MSTAALFVFAAMLPSASGLLVTPAELAAVLTRPATVLIHVEERPGEFAASHLPGARLVRFGDLAVDGPGELGAELPPLEVVRAVFAAAGVGPQSDVFLYGNAMVTARAFFTLDYLGHSRVRVLNGGLEAWRHDGRPVETGAAASAPGAAGSLASLTPRPEVVAYADWLARRLQAKDITLVDARPDAEFTGADGGMNGAHPAGHLDGARQLVWSALVTRAGLYQPDEDLRAALAAAGAERGVPVVSYCLIGMRASVIYFVARHLGYDAKLYDGSIVDWGRRKLPVRPGRQ